MNQSLLLQRNFEDMKIFGENKRTGFEVNPHFIAAWLSRNSLLELGVISEV